DAPVPATVTVTYRVYANELTVRTNHLDQTHGYFNGAALFFYLPGFEQVPITLTIVPPYPHWRVTTPLARALSHPPVSSAHTFYAPDFDTLVDSPVEIGTHTLLQFEVLGKPHELAIYGKGNLDPSQVITDISRVIETEAELFGGLPYDRYVFLLHLSSQGNGGLEHKYACSLNYPRFNFRAADKYNRFLQLVAHEFFHLWNVKRIRPKALETFNYDEENYTPSLWFSEGTTSYYDGVMPYRAGIYDVVTLIQHFSKEITRYQTTIGRLVQPLSESSFDAWIKLYRQDANSPNSQMSYYLKGEMVSLLLDLLIRQRHHNQRSLDDVMRRMWEQFGQPEVGFTPEDLQMTIEAVAETDLSDFFCHYVQGLTELPFNQYLAPFGLCLDAEDVTNHPPYLGVSLRPEHDRLIIRVVEAGSPAERAG
ncbi:MAG: peptidase M61, partial [Cyanobacteria bacterium]|nr:peptidase M61 [Cyanobacteriota bacterium]MDW8203331.1 peptidase M61 [Cyanobacteriota bacterium SKYGB_h_bin112]